MTEIVAAHLERELAELNQRLDGSNRCVTCGHWRNDHAMDLVGEHFCEHSEGVGTDCCNCQSYVGVVPPSYAELVLTLRRVAAALAACAREAARERAIVWELRPETSLSASDEIRLERRDGFKGRRWAITRRGYVLNKSGEWEYEPIPSSRTEEWLATTRWDTWEEAEAALERAAREKGQPEAK